MRQEYRNEDPAPEVMNHAGTALRLAMEGDMARAMAEVGTLGRGHGFEGVQDAMMAWVDQLGHVVCQVYGVPRQTLQDRLEGLGVWNAQTGHATDNVDELPPAPRWAVRMIHARLRMDPDLWFALMESVPDDRGVLTLHVAHLLEAVAATLNEIRTGGDRGGLFVTPPAVFTDPRL